ncbi:hypothetical protein [Actinophytocola algeriensis]|uniref:Uncharacterized protein n=1 Tax=Actinophytocola algeriensis TaxID=1768010 RepID=A0A7W7PZA3_9PSEU|nr:hypothetical protein [Actinophytocola algeriensis]MBB4904085.1 hypothetical protein [Actinophytocola algeriensis]MBE1477058.1 hypothetical protein [Actinophytocola algeriensis]
MTDDITRVLAALADEAHPAPVDSHTVIQLAAAHTRARRAVYTAAFATLVAIGALTVAIGAVRDPTATGPATSTTSTTSKTSTPAPTTKPTSPTSDEGIRQPATPEENAVRKPRLQADIIAAFDRILPAGWDHSTFGFGCDQTGCWTDGDIIDDIGNFNIHVYVGKDFGQSPCMAPSCVRRETLPDGTEVSFFKNTDDDPIPGMEPMERRGFSALRPDGTDVHFTAEWPTSREAPAVTDDEWIEFATVFTY